MTPEEMARSPRAACGVVRDMLGLKPAQDSRGPIYVGLLGRGDCPVFDYDAGVLCVTLFVAGSNIMMHINSLDDSGANGFGQPEITGGQARKKMALLANELNTMMGKVIYWEDFKRISNKYGVYIIME